MQRYGLLGLGFSALLACGAAPALAQSVGVAAAVNQSALGTPPGTKTRTLSLGDKVIHNEKIATNGKGLLQILLADGTSFTVGPNSNMTIDSFVYDPDADTAKVVATFGKGVFRFIGGRTSKSPDGAILDTPVGTVGIRGGIGDFDFSGHHGVPPHIDMLFGDSITLTRGGRQLGHLYQNGYSIVIGADGITVIPTPAAWTDQFHAALAGHPGAGHGGPGHNAASTEIASILTGPSGPPSGPNGSLPPAGSGPPGFQPPPVSPPSLPSSGTATWAEINNSSLANVYATYSGPASVDFSFTNPQQQAQSYTWNGQFYLNYYFGRANGSGNIAFKGTGADQGDDSDAIPVTPNTTGSGNAGFTGSESVDYGSNDYFHVRTSGQFTNTAAGVGNGVTGTVSIDAKGQIFDAPTNGIAVGETGSGTFSGNLKSTSASPPSAP